ncbi:MAG: CoA-binding protein [Bacteroidales bacterium]|nr:CoA-binding protein [Bacteroidales bacterium]
MKDTIQAFLDSGKVAIAGASPKKDNFGLSLMTELGKLGKKVYPVNPLYKEINGNTCFSSVRDLPEEVESLILAVPPRLCEEISEHCIDSGIKRVWMVRGVGKGAYSEKAHKIFNENQIEVVYGFCPLMFYGGGMHKFHLWLRKTFGTLPGEYQLSQN